MERMWAPWRMEYIKTVDEGGCFLCGIQEEECDRENLLLKRGDHCGIVMNRYPYTNGHLMVFPYSHAGELEGLTSAERAEMMDLAAECVSALRETVSPDGFNVGINLGRVAGAGLEEHVHTHIVPRWSGDTNFMPVFAEVKVIPQGLIELYDLLKPCFSRSVQ